MNGTYTVEATAFSAEGRGAYTLSVTSSSSQEQCLIFVHGSKETDRRFPYGTDWSTAYQWTIGRGHWWSFFTFWDLIGIGDGEEEPWPDSADDFLDAARDGRPYYVIRYNGAAPWWSTEAAGHVSTELIRAMIGLPDAAGHRCPVDSEFWVIAHSGGATIMDYILGNALPSSPNPNVACTVDSDGGKDRCTDNWPFDRVGDRLTGVISVGGAHRGTVLANNYCVPLLGGRRNPNCTHARQWLQTLESVQVSAHSSSPVKPVFLIGGYKGGHPDLTGEDDGVLSYGSQFACRAHSDSWNNTNLCDRTEKQELRNFYNIDGAHENHDEERHNHGQGRERRLVRDSWWCGSGPCAAGSIYRTNQSTASLIDELLDGRILSSAPSPTVTSQNAIRVSRDPLVESPSNEWQTFRNALRSALSLSLRAAKERIAPEPVVVEVFIDRRSQVSRPVRVEVALGHGGDLVATGVARDDGTAGDARAHDGIFTFSFVPVQADSDLMILVSAEADSGVTVTGSIEVAYRAPTAELSGRYFDRVVAGVLEIFAEVEVREESRVHIEGTIAAAGGEVLAWSESTSKLGPGRHWIPLRFESSTLARPGPFVLRSVSISSGNKLLRSNERVETPAYRTLAYTLDELEIAR